MVASSAETVSRIVERGVDLVFRDHLRPAEAAAILVHSPMQLDPDEQLTCIRRAVAALVEEALSARRRVPAFDVSAQCRPVAVALSEESVERIGIAAAEAARKLDAFYASQGGEMKPLRNFTAADHRWRADYAAAQAKAWGRWSTFHWAAGAALEDYGVEDIASLSESDQAMLEEIVP